MTMVLDRAGGQKYRKWRVWLVARPPKPSLVVENLLSLLLFFRKWAQLLVDALVIEPLHF